MLINLIGGAVDLPLLILTDCVPRGLVGPALCSHASVSSYLWQREGLQWTWSRPHQHLLLDWKRERSHRFISNFFNKHRCGLWSDVELSETLEM